jgi:hypothetical protein
MDEINPNIPNNGDEKLHDEQRLWVVSTGGSRRRRSRGPTQPGAGTTRKASSPSPRRRTLTATLEVVICEAKRDTERPELHRAARC